MSKKQYLKKVLCGIKCTSKMKADIRKQLEFDIQERMNNGETLDSILLQMGSAQEVADSFNENISDKEKAVCRRNKVLTIVGIIVVILVLIGIAINALIPKVTEIEESEYFNIEQVEEQVVVCIELLDDENYENLEKLSIPDMNWDETKEIVADGKEQISNDWGECISYGTIYMTELTQYGAHYVLCEVVAVYENISVTYTITFDQDMKLAGFYFK